VGPEMNIPVSLPLDSDGFLRRECPRCERQFKWHHGPADEEAVTYADPPAYYCPFCGEPATHGSWWTKEQIEYAHGMAAPKIHRFVRGEVGDIFRGTKNIAFRSAGSLDVPGFPVALVEPDDMQIITSPCHAYEPIKVPADPSACYYCLLCGERFAV
jgi:hypothetical protein